MYYEKSIWSLWCFLFANTVFCHEPHFEIGSVDLHDYLIDFAIASNDIYETRTAAREVAEQVFDIPESAFDNKMVFILKKNQDIIGFFVLQKTDTNCELTHLFVKANLQNKGFGSLLFDKVIETTKAAGYKKLTWTSDPDSANFYIKKGAVIARYDQNLLNPKIEVPYFEYKL